MAYRNIRLETYQSLRDKLGADWSESHERRFEKLWGRSRAEGLARALAEGHTWAEYFADGYAQGYVQGCFGYGNLRVRLAHGEPD